MDTHQALHSFRTSSFSSSFDPSSKNSHDPLIAKRHSPATHSSKSPRSTIPITLNFEDYIESLSRQSKSQPEQVSGEQSTSLQQSEPRYFYNRVHHYEPSQTSGTFAAYSSTDDSVNDSSIPRLAKRPQTSPAKLVSRKPREIPSMASSKKASALPIKKQQSAPGEKNSAVSSNGGASDSAQKKVDTSMAKDLLDQTPNLKERSSTPTTSPTLSTSSRLPKPQHVYASAAQRNESLHRAAVAGKQRQFSGPASTRDQDSSADETSRLFNSKSNRIPPPRSTGKPESSQEHQEYFLSSAAKYSPGIEKALGSLSSSDVENSFTVDKTPYHKIRRGGGKNSKALQPGLSTTSSPAATDSEFDPVPRSEVDESSMYEDSANGKPHQYAPGVSQNLSKSARQRRNRGIRKLQEARALAVADASLPSAAESEVNITESRPVASDSLHATDTNAKVTSAQKDESSVFMETADESEMLDISDAPSKLSKAARQKRNRNLRKEQEAAIANAISSPRSGTEANKVEDTLTTYYNAFVTGSTRVETDGSSALIETADESEMQDISDVPTKMSKAARQRRNRGIRKAEEAAVLNLISSVTARTEATITKAGHVVSDSLREADGIAKAASFEKDGSSVLVETVDMSETQDTSDIPTKMSKAARQRRNRGIRKAEEAAAALGSSIMTDSGPDLLSGPDLMQSIYADASPFSTTNSGADTGRSSPAKAGLSSGLKCSGAKRDDQHSSGIDKTEYGKKNKGDLSLASEASSSFLVTNQEAGPTKSAPHETDGGSDRKGSNAESHHETSELQQASNTESSEDRARQQIEREARLIDQQREKCEAEKNALRDELEQQQRQRCEEEKAALKKALEAEAADQRRQCVEEKETLKQAMEAKVAEEHRQCVEEKEGLKKELEMKATKATKERLASDEAASLARKAEASARKELTEALNGKEREYQTVKQTFENERTRLENHGRELSEQYSREKHTWQDQLSSLNEKLDSSMREIELLESHKEGADRNITTAKAELASRNEEMERLKKEIDSITVESEGDLAGKAELETRYNDAISELREIRRQLQECEAHRREAAVTSELTKQELDKAKAELSDLTNQKKEKEALQEAYDERAAEFETVLSSLESLERENRQLYRSLSDPTAVMNMQGITSAAADLHGSLQKELEDVNEDSDEGESTQTKTANPTLSEAVLRDLRHHRARVDDQEVQALATEETPLGGSDERSARKHVANTPRLVFRDNQDYLQTNDFFQLDNNDLRLAKDHVDQIINRQIQIVGKIFALGRRLGALEASEPIRIYMPVQEVEQVAVPFMEQNALKWWRQPYLDAWDHVKATVARNNILLRRLPQSAILQKAEVDTAGHKKLLLPPYQDVRNLLMFHLAVYFMLAILFYLFVSVRREAQIWKAANELTQQYLVALRSQSSNCCTDRPALIWQLLPGGKPDWVVELWYNIIRRMDVERALNG